jgi:hypothetical protein
MGRPAFLILAVVLVFLVVGCDYFSALFRGKKRVDKVGQFDSPDSITAIVTSGSNLYAAGDSVFAVLDIANPTQPIQVGRLPGGWSMVHDLAESNGRVYLANHFDGVDVIDVSTPSTPQMSASVSLEDGAFAIAAVGNYVYAAGLHNLYVLDATDPARCSVVGTYSGLPSGGIDLVAHGGYLYVLEGETSSGWPEVSVFDVSNPSEPKFVNSVTMSDMETVTCHADIVNETLYVSFSSVHALSLSDPIRPKVIWRADFPGVVQALAAAPGAVFVSTYNRQGELHVVYGEEICKMTTNESCRDIALSGEYVYVLGTGGGLRIYHYH